MKNKSVLVVDDEKNIRMTLSMTLESMSFQIQTAVNGEEALEKLLANEFWLILLDLKMPGMDGIEVLRRVSKKYPKIRVIIITAHGTIESAVEAMKLGAVDFIQKPFTANEIRELVNKVAVRETLDESKAEDYQSLIEICKRHITDRHIDLARETAQKAIAKDPAKPEAYNLLGAFLELRGDWLEAQKFYRAALDIDASYKPAKANLERTTSFHKLGKIALWPDTDKPEAEETDRDKSS
jgi:FixJ family two-component response regulator